MSVQTSQQFVFEDDGEVAPKSKTKLVLLVIGVGSVFWLTLCGVALWWLLGSSGDKAMCISHLKKTLDDPDSFEVAEWSEPVQLLLERSDKSYDPVTLLYLKFRTTGLLGGKMLRGHVFLIQKGKIIKDDRVYSNESLDTAVRRLGTFRDQDSKPWRKD